jgi:hypothetical protein
MAWRVQTLCEAVRSHMVDGNHRRRDPLAQRVRRAHGHAHEGGEAADDDEAEATGDHHEPCESVVLTGDARAIRRGGEATDEGRARVGRHALASQACEL